MIDAEACAPVSRRHHIVRLAVFVGFLLGLFYLVAVARISHVEDVRRRLAALAAATAQHRVVPASAGSRTGPRFPKHCANRSAEQMGPGEPAHVGRRGCSVAIAQDDLNAVTLVWGFAPHLLATDRIPLPPWENEGVKHYLATDTTPNENTTAAIHPAVMSPLLIWSLRFLDFADDIIAAWHEHQRILTRVRQHPNPDATAALHAFLDTWIDEHGELPGGISRGRREISPPSISPGCSIPANATSNTRPPSTVKTTCPSASTHRWHHQ